MSAEATLRDLVEFLGRALVDEPAAVQVHIATDAQGLHIELAVAPGDVGKVIGRGGRIARALRSVVRAAAARHDLRVTLEIRAG